MSYSTKLLATLLVSSLSLFGCKDLPKDQNHTDTVSSATDDAVTVTDVSVQTDNESKAVEQPVDATQSSATDDVVR